MADARVFRAQRVVDASEIDELGHASNIAYVRWVQDVALAHSAEVGLDVEAYRRLGGIFVVVRHEIDYMRPAGGGDRLEMRTWIASVMAAKCVRATEIVRLADERPLARGMTTWGFVDLTSGRPSRIPEAVRRAFAAYVPGAGSSSRG